MKKKGLKVCSDGEGERKIVKRRTCKEVRRGNETKVPKERIIRKEYIE